MHAILFSALLLGTAYAGPIVHLTGPVQDSPNPSTSSILQAKVHEKLSQPKQWYANVPEEVEAEVKSELAKPVPTTTDEPTKELNPEKVVDKMNWESKLGDNFRSFLSSIKEKHGSNRAEEPMVSVAPPASSTNNPQTPDHSDMNWYTKRSVIPSKSKKEDTPKKAEPVPEDGNGDSEDPVEITNEDFDKLFSYYAAKHDTRGYQGLQDYLDNILQHSSPSLKSKPWKPEPRPLQRRGGSGSHSTPQFSWTPEVDIKPAISINPEVFNRIAAEYKFDQNPTTINNEDNNFGPRLNGARYGDVGSQASEVVGGSTELGEVRSGAVSGSRCV